MGVRNTAYREECRGCVGNKDGMCRILETTSWMRPDYVCSFRKTAEQMKKDEELLKKRIAIGKVDTEKYGY